MRRVAESMNPSLGRDGRCWESQRSAEPWQKPRQIGNNRSEKRWLAGLIEMEISKSIRKVIVVEDAHRQSDPGGRCWRTRGRDRDVLVRETPDSERLAGRWKKKKKGQQRRPWSSPEPCFSWETEAGVHKVTGHPEKVEAPFPGAASGTKRICAKFSRIWAASPSESGTRMRPNESQSKPRNQVLHIRSKLRKLRIAS